MQNLLLSCVRNEHIKEFGNASVWQFQVAQKSGPSFLSEGKGKSGDETEDKGTEDVVAHHGVRVMTRGIGSLARATWPAAQPERQKRKRR